MLDIPKEIVTIQGQIAAMVIKDQENDKILQIFFSLKDYVKNLSESVISLSQQIEGFTNLSDRQMDEIRRKSTEIDECKAALQVMTQRMDKFEKHLIVVEDDNKNRYDQVCEDQDIIEKRSDKKHDDVLSHLIDVKKNLEVKISLIGGSVQESLDELAKQTKQFVESQIEKEHEQINVLKDAHAELYQEFSTSINELKISTEEFKRNTATKLSGAMEIMEKRFIDIAESIKKSVENSGVRSFAGRIEQMEVEIGLITKKIELSERQLDGVLRKLDAVQVAVKSISLGK